MASTSIISYQFISIIKRFTENSYNLEIIQYHAVNWLQNCLFTAIRALCLYSNICLFTAMFVCLQPFLFFPAIFVCYSLICLHLCLFTALFLFIASFAYFFVCLQPWFCLQPHLFTSLFVRAYSCICLFIVLFVAL